MRQLVSVTCLRGVPDAAILTRGPSTAACRLQTPDGDQLPVAGDCALFAVGPDTDAGPLRRRLEAIRTRLGITGPWWQQTPARAGLLLGLCRAVHHVTAEAGRQVLLLVAGRGGVGHLLWLRASEKDSAQPEAPVDMVLQLLQPDDATVSDARDWRPASRGATPARDLVDLRAALDVPRLFCEPGADGGHRAPTVLARRGPDAVPFPAPFAYTAPASAVQEEVWFLYQSAPDPAYHIPALVRLPRRWCPRRTARCVRRLIARHPALRGALLHGPGGLQQAFGNAVQEPWWIDLRGLDTEAFYAFAEQVRRVPIDMAGGRPVRLLLLMHDARLYLYKVAHQTFFDGLSSRALFRELSLLYAAPDDAEPAWPNRRIADFAVWQRAQLTGARGAAARAFWQNRAPALKAAPLPLPATPASSAHGIPGTYITSRPAAEHEGLRGWCLDRGVSVFAALLSGLALVMRRAGAPHELVLTTVVSGRPSHQWFHVLGCFLNMVLLPLKTVAGDTPSSLVGRVHAILREVLAHDLLPFRDVMQLLGYGGPRAAEAFPVGVIYQNWVKKRYRAFYGGTDSEDSPVLDDRVHEIGRQALTVEVVCYEKDVRCYWKYDGVRVSRETAQTMAEAFASLMTCLAGPSPDEHAWRLPTAVRPATPAYAFSERAWSSAPDLAYHIYRQRSDASALEQNGKVVGYAALCADAAATAARLRELGVGMETLVALVGRPGNETVAAMVAIYWAGAVLLVLDPTQCDAAHAARIRETGCRILFGPAGPEVRAAVDVCTDWVQGAEEARPPVRYPAEAGAYLAFTSGSTGTPKGIMVSRGNLAAFAAALAPTYGFTASDRVLQFAPFSFDTSMEEVWCTLFAGACLVTATMEPTREGFEACLTAAAVTVVDLPTALFHQLFSGPPTRWPDSVRCCIIGGEEALPAPITRFLATVPGACLFNSYGPTEATVVTTVRAYGPGEAPTTTALGRPAPHAAVYLCDKNLQPTPAQEVGELYLGGEGVARGYWGQPARTAACFLPDPFAAVGGARLYRSGDAAVLCAGEDGYAYRGRLDRMLKLEGRRVHPEEIEAAMTALDGVVEAHVGLLAAPDGRRQLTAWYAADGGATYDPPALRAALIRVLPTLRVPHRLLRVPALPRTVSGKPDVTRLPQHGPQSADVAAPDLIEHMVAEVFREALGGGDVARDETFFVLGGTSLAAAGVLSRLNGVFGAGLSLRDFYDAATVSALAARIRGARDSSGPVPPARDRGTAPLPPAATRMFLLCRNSEAARAYMEACVLRLEGCLSVPALETAFRLLAQRHDALRATVAVPVSGEARFRFDTAHDIALQVVDTASARATAHAAALARRALDPEVAPPWRITLFRSNTTHAWLLLELHHLMCDAWSLEVLARELCITYAAAVTPQDPRLPEKTTCYADVAHAQCGAQRPPELLAWWQTRLAGVRAVALPYDRPRPRRQGFQGGEVVCDLPPRLGDALTTLARGLGVTVFSTLLTGFATLLSRYGHSDDITTGIPIAGRGRAGTADVMGLCVDTLVVRLGMAPDAGFAARVRGTHAALLDTLAHDAVSLEDLLKLTGFDGVGANPLCQTTFQVLTLPPARTAATVRFCPEPTRRNTARYDLSLHVFVTETGLRCCWEYDCDLFDHETAARMAGHFRQLMADAAARPDAPVYDLSMMDASERARLLRAGQGRADVWPTPADPAALLARQVAARGTHTAVGDRLQQLTYAELDARADALAGLLYRRGVRAGDRVGICLNVGTHLVVALAAVVKLHAVYVCLSTEETVGRLGFMIADTGLRHVVTQATPLFQRLPEVILVHPMCGGEPAPAQQADLGDDAPMYICYTSGSTGTPKGVVVRRRGVLRLICDRRYVAPAADDVVALAAHPAFDALTFEVWTALWHGLSLTVIDKLTVSDPVHLAAALREMSVTTAFFTSAVFHQCAAHDPAMFAPMRRLLFGGERADAGLVAAVAEACPRTHLVHVYGPTEATTFTTYAPIAAHDPEVPEVPIGTPLAHTDCRVLDAGMLPVPRGVMGELYIGGAAPASGYLNRPAATAAAFVPDPFSNQPGARLYRTGDLVRCIDAGGNLVFLRRRDSQVKLLGHRIEPDDITAVLRLLPGVREAYTAPRTSPARGLHLVAWVAADAPDGLRDALVARLPAYMVPAAIVAVPRLPLKAQGKVDGAALPDPKPHHFGKASDEAAPRNAVEALLVQVMEDLLPETRVGIFDNLPGLGLHSLAAARAANRLQAERGVRVPLELFFEQPTVAGLAAFVADAEAQMVADGEEAGEEGLI